MIAARIRKALRVVAVFLRREMELWVVLLILVIGGVFGSHVLDRIEDTQTALCRSAHAAAQTKDRFIDAVVRNGNDENDPFVQELRGYVDEERTQLLKGECNVPSQFDLTVP